VAHYVQAKKALGQHFLADPNIAFKIANSLTASAGLEHVLEIGPGTGMLTRFLLDQKGLKWHGIELDRDSVKYLQEAYPDLKEQIIHGDFLKFSPETYFGMNSFAIIGNFPYNISTQILFHVLRMRDKVPEVVGMFQKEVARRIAAPPGNKEYGILSVLMQAFYDVKLLFDVEPHVFIPPPKVKSSVIRCLRKENVFLGCDEKLFFTVVKTAFNQRRKTLRNSLKGMQVNWNELPDQLSGERPERLDVATFVQITKQAGIGL